MVRNRNQLAWVVAACVAVVAQIAPKPLCYACDKPCCASQASSHDSQTSDCRAELASRCPLCATTADLRPDDTSEQHCDCHLNARHDQPLSATRDTLSPSSDSSVVLRLPAVPPAVPHALGLSQEYLAKLLGIPIRPPRILFGVWRN